MVDQPKRPKLVGEFIRSRREALNLSQRALGMKFTPPVTTQFISNIERGVTPLPPAHIQTLTLALEVSEAELMALLEREYTARLSGRLGHMSDSASGPSSLPSNHPGAELAATITVSRAELPFLRALCEAWQKADDKAKQSFAAACESILNIRKP